MPELNAQVASGQQGVPNAGAQSQVDGAGNLNTANTTPNTTTANNAVTTPTAGAQSQVDDAGLGDDNGLTREQALRELARVRREAAEHRTARKQLEADRDAAARAQMTREERLAADLADAERVKSELVIKHQERALSYEVQLQAATLGIVDPEAAAKLLDTSLIEYDDAGTPKNIGKLLKELTAAKPYLIAGQRPAPPVVSPTNPASDAGRSNIFTTSQIDSMSQADWKKNKAAIFQAMREGRIRQG